MVRIPPCFISPDRINPCSGPLSIVQENHDFLALFKPATLPVHPGTGHEDCLVSRVMSRFPGEAFRPTPVHRLDRDTTGLILFARSYPWLRKMQDMWNSNLVEKIYLAWVHGKWPCPEGPMKDSLVRRRDRVTACTTGKPALSWVVPVLERPGMTLLKIALSTGRTHQIRVQLSRRGFPVAGDLKYGRADRVNSGMLLHCLSISWEDMRLSVAPDWPEGLMPPEDLTRQGPGNSPQ